jgi:hypothetical protein
LARQNAELLATIGQLRATAACSAFHSWGVEFGLAILVLALIIMDRVARPIWARYCRRPYPVDW